MSLQHPLQDHTVAIFAATGAISSAFARACVAQGAQVYLSSHDADRLAPLAEQLGLEPSSPRVARVDATDDGAVAAWLDAVVDHAGSLHAVFNGIGGRPRDLEYPADARELSLDDFMVPLHRIVGSTFLTSRNAARRMKPGGSIVTLSATLSSMTARYMSNITATCGAVEALTRSLAGEFGPAGIRVNCVRGSGMPETRTIQETGAGLGALGEPIDIAVPPLGRPITTADTAQTAAFLASNAASGITGQVVTVCGGAFVG